MRLFKDEERLSPEYVPSKLPHREKEFSILKSFFSSLISGKTQYSVRAVITGSVGTGKTSLAKLCGQEVELEARKNRRIVHYIHINCRINRSLYSVLRRLSEVINAPVPKRGFSDEEVMHSLLKYLSRSNTYVILGLDEAEVLFSEEGAEPFYFLSRIGEETEAPGRLSIIVILRDPEVLDRLDAQTRSSLLGTAVHLSEYSYEQLLDIIRYRADEAFYPDVLAEETLEFLADVSAERGDARYAIDLLWRSGKFAEADNSEKITPEHVRRAIASVYPTIRRENLSYLSRDEALILLACAKTLSSNRAYTTSAEIFDIYKLVCEEKGAVPKGYTRFWETLQKLQDLGFLSIRVRSEGSRGGRKSHISLPGIPASLLEAELSKAINASNKS